MAFGIIGPYEVRVDVGIDPYGRRRSGSGRPAAHRIE